MRFHGGLPFFHSDLGAVFQHYLRGAFHVKQHDLRVVGADHGSHELVFRGEGHLLDDAGMVAVADVVDILFEEPRQQGGFGGVAHGLGFFLVGEVEECRRVHGDTLFN